MLIRRQYDCFYLAYLRGFNKLSCVSLIECYFFKYDQLSLLCRNSIAVQAEPMPSFCIGLSRINKCRHYMNLLVDMAGPDPVEPKETMAHPRDLGGDGQEPVSYLHGTFKRVKISSA